VAAGDVLECASHDRGEDCAQQHIARGVGEVVVAATLVGAQDGQLVVGADGDDRLAGMDAGMLAGPDGPQQRGSVCRSLQAPEDQHVDRVG
jgi:hypothetical protein